MQHTLIPNAERKAIRKEYRIRALIVCLFFISIAGMIGIAALFPSFLEASMSEKSAAQAMQMIEKEKNAGGAGKIEATLTADQALLGVLSGASSSPYSRIITDTIAGKGSLRIASISVGTLSGAEATIVLQGVAPTREALLAFKKSLESKGRKVDLPVSELAKSIDVPFSLKIVENLP